jgi:hypothetical protein
MKSQGGCEKDCKKAKGKKQGARSKMQDAIKATVVASLYLAVVASL